MAHLYGTVKRGPTMPVCRTGIPCSEPASGAKLHFARNGRVVALATVGKDGSYSIELVPGTYTVTVAPTSIGRGLEPTTVRVVAGPWRKRNFAIDTGIR